jgi:hypothetical protein
MIRALFVIFWLPAASQNRESGSQAAAFQARSE